MAGAGQDSVNVDGVAAACVTTATEIMAAE